jgi:two-component system OmpR family response regulator
MQSVGVMECLHGECMRILLIEDDQRLVNLVTRVLKEEGYQVDSAMDGDTGLEFALRGTYDSAIIDWMLPGRDGPSIVRAMRAARLSTGIILLTALDQVENRVAGLDSGADDYLTKPFAFDELLARLRSLDRRVQKRLDRNELRIGEIVMDLDAHSLRRGNKTIDLTRTEWGLLEYFLRHPGMTLTRQNILDYVWSMASNVKPELVDVYIAYLRQKMNVQGRSDPIETIRGVGYRLDEKRA